MTYFIYNYRHEGISFFGPEYSFQGILQDVLGINWGFIVQNGENILGFFNNTLQSDKQRIIDELQQYNYIEQTTQEAVNFIYNAGPVVDLTVDSDIITFNTPGPQQI